MRPLIAAWLCFVIALAPLYSFAEGEDDPLWAKNTYAKKVRTIGNRILEANGITQRIVFFIGNDGDGPNATANEVVDTVKVDRALLELIESDNELAAVLSHEIAHLLEKHYSKARRRGAITGAAMAIPLLAIALGGTILGASPYLMSQVVTDGVSDASVGASRAFGREYEYEADANGFNLMEAAGYDPNALYSVLDKIVSDGNLSEFNRTHPLGSKRLAKIAVTLNEYNAQRGISRILGQEISLIPAPQPMRPNLASLEALSVGKSSPPLIVANLAF